MAELRVAADPQALAAEAARLMAEEIRALLAGEGRAAVILAGGSTPRGSYERLAAGLRDAGLPLERLTWLPGDERWVPAAHPDSNEAMIRRALLDPAGIPAERLLSWEAGRGDPVQAAARFEDRLRERLGLAEDGTGGDGPCRALLVLGLGADGHTASLFPDAEAALPDGRRVPVSPDLPGLAAAVHRPAGRTWRLTLTPRFLRGAGRILFLVSGAEKRGALREVLGGNPARPGSWLNLPRTVFLATRDAAGADGP